MARRRPPEATVDHDLGQPPPNWTARHVWRHRWGMEHRGPLPEYRAQSWRTVYNAGPLEPHLERARARWAALTDDQRRDWWATDDHHPGPEATPCRHHGGQAVALCPQEECPTVARLQAEHDREHAHYWRPGAI